MLNRLGKWKLISLETGDFWLDGGAMMGSVPKVLWEKTNPSDKLNRIKLSMRCMLLDDGDSKILIETGLGDKIDHSFIKRFEVDQPKFPLKERLNEGGYKMEDITHVLLTHLHFDHAGGATTIDHNGEIVPAFSNAEYYISLQNWEAALNPSPRDSASYLDINYKVLEKSGQLNLISENSLIIEGISTLMFHGHTYGQQLIKVESEGESIVFCADLIPLKSHLSLPWIMGYDLNASLTLKEKTSFLKEASKNNWWLWFYHDPEYIAVRIAVGRKYYDITEQILRR